MLIRQDGTILFEGRDGHLYEAYADDRDGQAHWWVVEVLTEYQLQAYPPACKGCGFAEPVCCDGYCKGCHTDQQAGCLRGL